MSTLRQPQKAGFYLKARGQSLILLSKAAQDEVLLDQILTSVQVSDEIIGFHCQQAAEKMLKALSDIGIRFRKTHEIGALMLLLAQAGYPLPQRLETLDALTPFGAVYRYEDYDSPVSLDRMAAREALRTAGLGRGKTRRTCSGGRWVEGTVSRKLEKEEVPAILRIDSGRAGDCGSWIVLAHFHSSKVNRKWGKLLNSQVVV